MKEFIRQLYTDNCWLLHIYLSTSNNLYDYAFLHFLITHKDY